MSAPRPIHRVLSIGGHDPTGGAGLQADIEAISAQHCRAFTLVTALTAQNTQKFFDMIPVDATDFLRQAGRLLADIPMHACKIGLIPDVSIAKALASLFTGHLAGCPVVLDPVLASGGGHVTADLPTREAILKLLPHVAVLTPNSEEARKLTGEKELPRAAEALRRRGCMHVLITGTHEDTPQVLNTLYNDTGAHTFACERLPHIYHGSGCTLASALAAHLALGVPVPNATQRALDYTWNTLKNAQHVGQGQWHPLRLLI
ncbi:MAG TPA: hydroxymethylpyrimidine/phosphomethylpyrimidine kinase [Gammaproteobacteria bacterium]|nr:hydroxymethylpyrimidine/phosphomethylpyrimidine kinase [Gammaproteobacteria bacterium]